jgi:hypothetical protein
MPLSLLVPVTIRIEYPTGRRRQDKLVSTRWLG